MTTKLTIVNHGPKAIVITGTTSGTMTVQPNRHAEVWLSSSPPLSIEEAEPVTPNLAGGPGEPHP